MAAKGSTKKAEAEPEKAPAVKTEVHTDEVEAVPGEGITGFSVTAGISEEYATDKTATTLHYTFGRPVEVVDICTKHHEMSQLVSDLELEGHAQHLAKKKAELHQATQQVQPQAPAPAQQPVSPPQPGPPQGITQPQPQQPPGADMSPPWATGAKPNGGGTIRFIPTRVFPTAAFEMEVYRQLSDQGLDPSLYEVWDNRASLEGGQPGWGCGSVKPQSHNPLVGALGSTPAGYPKAAFYIDFADNGAVVLKPTKEFTAAHQPQQQAWAPPPQQ